MTESEMKRDARAALRLITPRGRQHERARQPQASGGGRKNMTDIKCGKT